MIALVGLLAIVTIAAVAVTQARRGGHHARSAASASLLGTGPTTGLPNGAHEPARAAAPAPAPVPGWLASAPPSGPVADAGLDAAIARWTVAGLLTEEQGAAIAAHEHHLAEQWAALPPPPSAWVVPARPERRVPVVAEALGYLGGILSVVGLVLIISRYWADLATGGRLALGGIAAAALVAAGFAVHEEVDPALARLRWALWLGGTAAAGLTAAVAADALSVESPQGIALASAATVTVLSALLWRDRDRVVQQATTLVGGLVTAGTAVLLTGSDLGAGLTVWFLAAVLVGAGLLRRTTAPLLTEAIGFAGVAVGAVIVAGSRQGPGAILLVASALAILALAVGPSPGDHADRVLAAILGGLLLSQSLPSVIGYFAQGAGLVTGLVVWACGAVLLALGYRHLVRTPVVVQLGGGAALLVGAAVTGVQWPTFAPLFGLATALALLALGTLPRGILCSLFGAVGLLANVPWTITRFFPGESRAPLLILASGAVIIGVAVFLGRSGDRFRTELGHHPEP